jgi:hypothetical protein
MHYTSVPNILKVLGPLFLNELRARLEEAGDNPRMLLNLRKRMARIRVFDPACGSGNFLVIAYKQLREIENTINERRGEPGRKSDIPVTNFRGIELRDFAAEIARLALIIAEYQCDLLYRGQKEALDDFLPLDAQNWITCWNPPYKGSQTQNSDQKSDLAAVFDPYGISSKQIDYVGGWFIKAAAYAQHTMADSAFVSTNSICQGRIVPILWPKIFETGSFIHFAHTSFKWANLASHNAGVTVAIVGLSRTTSQKRRLYDLNRDGETTVREAPNIAPYLTIGENIVVISQRQSVAGLHDMSFGNMPVDGGNLLISSDEVIDLGLTPLQREMFIRRIYGSAEYIRGIVRYCLWIADDSLSSALEIDSIRKRIDAVRAMRRASKDAGTKLMAARAHQFREMNHATNHTLILSGVSSEGRDNLPVGLLDSRATVSNLAFALYDAPLWNMALIASRLHLVWIGTVCGKLKTDFRYSNTLGWNTFPVPTLTEKNKADLTRCAEGILLAREAHFPATIADLYDPDAMSADLRQAHERNDEVLERIYIGRRFRNDTERLEKLFKLYTKMTANGGKAKSAAKATRGRKA